MKPVEVAKPKKPAGAVSMFGGMDPSVLIKKKSPAPSASAKPGKHMHGVMVLAQHNHCCKN